MTTIRLVPWLGRSICWSTSAPRSIFSVHQSRHLSTVDIIPGSFDSISVDDFRERAFAPERPALITTRDGGNGVNLDIGPGNSIPALLKWFCHQGPEKTESQKKSTSIQLDYHYLSKYGNTILPYELIVDPEDQPRISLLLKQGLQQDLAEQLLADLNLQSAQVPQFRRFDAPLSVFLSTAQRSMEDRLKKLYIAQAQIADLPKELQDDLPTPRLVREAGKGDVYDANIWLGLPPTYTPLHKDPNPNLFVQVASSKKVRIFSPHIGRAIFHNVQKQIGQQSSASFRGNEMMEGPERSALDEAVWGNNVVADAFEAVVHRGDALFIPKGWWHSIKSIGNDVSMSVNWWFR